MKIFSLLLLGEYFTSGPHIFESENELCLDISSIVKFDALANSVWTPLYSDYLQEGAAAEWPLVFTGFL